MISGEASCIYLGPLRRSLETKGSWLRCFDQERISIVGRRHYSRLKLLLLFLKKIGARSTIFHNGIGWYCEKQRWISGRRERWRRVERRKIGKEKSEERLKEGFARKDRAWKERWKREGKRDYVRQRLAVLCFLIPRLSSSFPPPSSCYMQLFRFRSLSN